MRTDIDSYMSMIALVVSTRATCVRRNVGAVIVDGYNNILSTGYNGPPAGARHCTDIEPCPGATAAPGTGLDQCRAIHAEANAIIHCRNIHDARTIYCTDSPCIHCIKLLQATPIRRIVYLRDYPHPDSKNIWRDGGRSIEALKTLSESRPIADVLTDLGMEMSRITAESI